MAVLSVFCYTQEAEMMTWRVHFSVLKWEVKYLMIKAGASTYRSNFWVGFTTLQSANKLTCCFGIKILKSCFWELFEPSVTNQHIKTFLWSARFSKWLYSQETSTMKHLFPLLPLFKPKWIMPLERIPFKWVSWYNVKPYIPLIA